MMTATDSAPTVQSRWWYLVALALVTSLAATVTYLYYLAVVRASLGGSVSVLPILSLGTAGALQFAVVLAALATGFLGAVGVRVDGMRVRRYTEWSPDSRRYAYGTVAAAILFPPLVAAVAGHYLYRRHRHVGTP